MAGQKVATVFDVQISFDCRYHDVTDKPTQTEDDTRHQCFTMAKRGQPWRQDHSKDCRSYHAAQQPFDRLVWTHRRNYLMPAEQEGQGYKSRLLVI